MYISNKILNKVELNIKKYNMLEYGDKVVVGVSGGADSMMLLHVLNSLKDKYNLTIIVAHVNHKIRKGDAEKDASFVESVCKSMGLEFHLKEAYIKDLAKELGMSEEEAGRKVRYEFFKELAGEDGKIATAHNLNDNIETVLMRFIRGTGVKGLGGISYKRGNIIRPILSISRKDIESYLEENNLSHITDKTNFESIYTRNKIRLELIPYILNKFNPNFVETLSNNIVSYQEDADYFEKEVDKFYSSNIRFVENGVIYVSKHDISDLHPALCKRIFIKIIKNLMNTEQINISSNEIDKLYNFISNDSGSVFTLHSGYQVRISYDNLIFEKYYENKKSDNIYELNVSELNDKIIDIDDYNLKLHFEKVYETQIVNTPNIFYLPLDLYKNEKLFVRLKTPEDIYRVEDNVHKKLNKVMSDKKVDRGMRDILPLLSDKNEVLCVFNYFVTRYGKRDGEFLKVSVCD